MKRIVLARRAGGLVDAYVYTDEDQAPTRESLVSDSLVEFVEEHETEVCRWVWDDTAHWYPDLLKSGVTVRRCTDLRLCHNILRRSPFVDQSYFTGHDLGAWDRLQPTEPETHTLFSSSDFGETLDVVAEDRRQRAASEASSEHSRLTLLLNAESAGALAAAEMTHVGLPWSVEAHEGFLSDRLGQRPKSGRRPQKLEALVLQIREALGAPELNPDSPAELLIALQTAGVDVSDTRSWRLERESHPAIPAVLEFKKLTRLLTANGWHWIDRWIEGGRFRTQLLVGGVVTGRWSARGGGALQFPAELRRAVVADPGWKLVIADVAQLEPRVLAGCSRDYAMATAARATDLYEGMVATGAVATRNDAKLGLLGAMYGATRGEGGRMVERMMHLYPDALAHVEAAARTGERGDVVHTLLGRGSPRPDADWIERSPDDIADSSEHRDGDRRAWGRFTRNFIIQGTGAEWALCWIADLRNRLYESSSETDIACAPHVAFFLHDEVVIHTPEHLADRAASAVQASAKRAGRLLFGDFPVDFPLDVAVVNCWADA